VNAFDQAKKKKPAAAEPPEDAADVPQSPAARRPGPP